MMDDTYSFLVPTTMNTSVVHKYTHTGGTVHYSTHTIIILCNHKKLLVKATLGEDYS